MAPDILATHDAIWIDTLNDILEVVELGVQRLDILGLKRMLLCPMRSTTVRGQ
jgi:hypothetical protein